MSFWRSVDPSEKREAIKSENELQLDEDIGTPEEFVKADGQKGETCNHPGYFVTELKSLSDRQGLTGAHIEMYERPGQMSMLDQGM